MVIPEGDCHIPPTAVKNRGGAAGKPGTDICNHTEYGAVDSQRGYSRFKLRRTPSISQSDGTIGSHPGWHPCVSESQGTGTFGLFFRVCHHGVIDLGCTPYFIGPVPWLPSHEKGLIFVGETQGTPPPSIQAPDTPQAVQDLINHYDPVDQSIQAKYAFEQSPDFRPTERSPEAMGAVALARGITGYFVPFVCGANCDTSKVIWEQHGYRYKAGIRYATKATIVNFANSAILNEK